MSLGGYGRKSIFKSKFTLIIFAILVFAGVGVQYLPIPSMVGLLSLPADIVYGLLGVTNILSNAGVPSSNLIDTGVRAVFYYVFAVAVAFLIKKFKGNRDPFS